MSHPSNKVTHGNVADVMTYHKPSEGQVGCFEAVSEAGQEFIRAILLAAPECADRSAAIRCVREARMWANAAIALGPKEEDVPDFQRAHLAVELPDDIVDALCAIFSRENPYADPPRPGANPVINGQTARVEFKRKAVERPSAAQVGTVDR